MPKPAKSPADIRLHSSSGFSRNIFCTLALLLSCLSLLSSIFGLQVAVAEEAAMQCVMNSQSRNLQWKANWQSDFGDDGVAYRIANISPPLGGTSARITLELVARGTALKSLRYLTVDSEAFAREVCAQISGPMLPRAEPKVTPEPIKPPTPKPTPAAPQASSKQLPVRFIAFVGKSWVLADAPPKENLSVCEVLEQKFLCREEDKRKHSDKLSDLEQELELEKAGRRK